MSKIASQYPTTFPYGATDDTYYGPDAKGKPTYIGPYHRGEDRKMPVGTPVLVNGVQIGLSGRSGAASGPHLHIGRFVNGGDTNPKGTGFNFKSAIVTQVSYDPKDGYFVRVQGDGASYVYLHLSKQTCRVGQKLVAPKPAYPRWIKVSSKGGANVRSQPSTVAPLAGSRYLPYGMPFRVSGVVRGQSIAGNRQWFKTMYGHYVWSGNVK